MVIDMEGLEAVRTSLAADGYAIDVEEEEGDRIGVVISATPNACAECLVPQSIMVPILEHALKVPADRIDLTYPEAHDEAAGEA